ncbi:MAG TPA: response regulator transcription factor [Tepidiformaceae bacterium]|nr:response regulator transcription factor [Tepidiformaceae bacterium]
MSTARFNPTAHSASGFGKISPDVGGRQIRVLLVDDHAVIRQALRMLLESRPELSVVGDAENGRAALRAVEQLHPDVVLMDVVMPGLNGIEATRQIRQFARGSRVVMLSGFVDEEQLTQALRAGASGYLMKSSDVSELVIAIQTVHRGNTYYSSGLADGFDLDEISYRSKRPADSASTESLTPREREVLQLIAEGHTNQRVADELVISVKTVEAHKAHIMTKLHARTRTDLIRYALIKGIVHLESVAEAEKMLGEPDLAAE